MAARWSSFYGLGGYFFGDNVHRLAGPLGLTTIALGLLITITSLACVRRNEQRLEEEAERPCQPMYLSLPAELLRTVGMCLQISSQIGSNRS
jgi:hypothetical protein